MRITRRALASTYVLRHLITAALDFVTGERRSTPGREYDFESEVEDEEEEGGKGLVVLSLTVVDRITSIILAPASSLSARRRTSSARAALA